MSDSEIATISSQVLAGERNQDEGAPSKGESLNSQVFSVSLDDFDGPIDLLLHLVKRQELPIEKLSLARVADQYLECINQTIGFDLELAGEYLVIAATLLSIKAALLLDPKSDQVIEFDDGPNPHDELLRRLREAEVYQEAARLIGNKHFLGIDVFAAEVGGRATRIANDTSVELAQHDSNLLVRALKRVVASIPQPVAITINWNRVSISERMQHFVECLLQSPQREVTFAALLGEHLSLPVVVSSFIALLELCKRQVISVRQSGHEDEITIVLRDIAGDMSEYSKKVSESEFDLPLQVVNNG